MQRIRDSHISKACEAYNKAIGATEYNSLRRLQWADIRGDGSNRRRLYSVCNFNGGVCNSHLQRKTMRETLKAIKLATDFARFPSYCVIIQCIWERGATQAIALDELARRGLWLSDEQKKQAGLL